MKTKKTIAGEGTYEKMPKEAEKQERLLANGLNPNVLIFEEAFVKVYHHVETQLKEREIKFFRCIGDPALTKEEGDTIRNMRENNKNYLTNFQRSEDLHRYSTTHTNERIVVPIDIQCKPNCKWNILDNDLFSLRQRHLNNLVKMSTILMIRIRASIRLEKIKKRFDEVIWFNNLLGKC